MDAEWGMDTTLDEFLLARIAEDNRMAVDAAEASGGETWDVDALPCAPVEPPAAEHVARYDPARIRAECAAKRRIVMACREARPEEGFLGARTPGLANFPRSPRDQHQLATLTLALLALPYADHRDYREEWRP